MHELSSLGALTVAGQRRGRRVPIATLLGVGETVIAAPADPRLLPREL